MDEQDPPEESTGGPGDTEAAGAGAAEVGDQKLPGLRDADAEAALGEGRDVSVLERVLGRRATRRFRDLIGRTQPEQRTCKVLVVPGVMGCRLGIPGRLFDDEIWMDPLDVRRGHLDRIALDDDRQSEAQVLGVLQSAYLGPKLWLQGKGYPVELYAYDWRQGVEELGRALAAKLTAEAHDDVRIVTHSYGGLVTRAALKFGAPGVTRVVTLGTPHLGAWATAMVLRGVHPIVLRLAALDHRHDPVGMAARIFRTFPSLHHLLPAEGLETTLDVYDSSAWPDEPASPHPAHLAEAAAARWCLAELDERFTCVAGYGHDTPLDLVRSEAGLAYPLGNSGDSIVPVQSAAPEGTRQYYVEAGHGTLPNVPPVLRALPDLIETGETDQLAAEPPTWTTRPGTDDAMMAEDFQDLLESLRRPSPATLRALLTEFAAPVEAVD